MVTAARDILARTLAGEVKSASSVELTAAMDEDDEGDDAPNDEPQNLQIHGLIDSEVGLTHWTGPNGTRLEETSLSVAVGEVCASTPTDVLKPSESEYKGGRTVAALRQDALE
jgi:hypothetical protein